jgi:hypothetical protein
MSDTSRFTKPDPLTAEPFRDVETAIAETTRVIAALRDRWPEGDNEESLEDTLRYLADCIATGVPGLFVPTPAHLEPYRLEAIRKATGEVWSDDDEEDAR